MTTTTPSYQKDAFELIDQNDGQGSNGFWVLLSLANIHSCFLSNSDKVAEVDNLLFFAQRCIGAGCEPRVRPLPGQNDQSASLAAPAEADQAGDTYIKFCQYCGSSDIEHFCHTLPDCSASCNSCGAHLFHHDPKSNKITFDGWYEIWPTTLEQFQRWLETVAHMASRDIVPGSFSPRCLVNSGLIYECRIATKLLMQFRGDK